LESRDRNGFALARKGGKDFATRELLLKPTGQRDPIPFCPTLPPGDRVLALKLAHVNFRRPAAPASIPAVEGGFSPAAVLFLAASAIGLFAPEIAF